MSILTTGYSHDERPGNKSRGISDDVTASVYLVMMGYLSLPGPSVPGPPLSNPNPTLTLTLGTGGPGTDGPGSGGPGSDVTPL